MSARGAVLVAAGVLLLAGCQSDPEVIRADPTPSASTSVASPSPSVSESAEAETAEEYLRRWISLDTEMQNSGNTGAYLAATGACVTCQKFAQRVASYYAAGGYVHFSGQTVSKIKRFASNSDVSLYDVYVEAEPTEYRESSDAKVKTFPGGPARYRATIELVGTTWTMRDYIQVATP